MPYLLDVCVHLKGNPRGCLWTEPLWGIPYNLYCPYAALYMALMGLDAYKIGLVTSVYYVSQAFASVMSGVLADKLGRRKCTIIFDTLSWSVPTCLWTLAQNEYWFIAAAFFNGFWRITDNSWGLLMVEDADKDKVVSLYSITSMMGLLAAFAAPLSALAVDRYGVLSTMRVLYAITCVSMTSKFIILYHLTVETRIGKRRMEATRDKSYFKLIYECKDVFLEIIREKRMLLTLGIMAAFSLVNILQENYSALYLTGQMGIAESYMSVFSMFKSVVRLILLMLFARWLQRHNMKHSLLLGWLLFIAGQITLLLNPGGTLAVPFAFAETALEAAALSILYPVTGSLLFVNAAEDERARINGMIFSAVALLSAAFPALIGYFANYNIKIPFITSIFIYMIAIAMTAALFKNKKEGAPHGIDTERN